MSSLSIVLLGANVQAGRGHFRRAAATDLRAGLMFPMLTGGALALGTGTVGALFAIALAGLVAALPVWRYQSELEPSADATPLRIQDAPSRL